MNLMQVIVQKGKVCVSTTTTRIKKRYYKSKWSSELDPKRVDEEEREEMVRIEKKERGKNSWQNEQQGAGKAHSHGAFVMTLDALN